MENGQLTPKRVSESRTEQIQILMPAHINGYKRLFGGKLMEWIDVVAAVVARRHANREITTACVDSLEFQSAAHVNSTIVLVGALPCGQDLHGGSGGHLRGIAGWRAPAHHRAYLVMVALDDNEQPTPVPGLILETDEEKQEWEAAIKRRALRKQRAAGMV